MNNIILVSTAILVNKKGKLLLTQRPLGKNMEGLWEFPGGKLEPNETPFSAVIREIQEELAVRLDPTEIYNFSFAYHDYTAFRVCSLAYCCFAWQGEISGNEGQQFRWVDIDQIADFQLIPPISEQFINDLKLYLGSRCLIPLREVT